MNKQSQVIITDFLHDELEPERQILGEIAEVTTLGAYGEEELVGRIERADAMIVYHEVTVGRQTIERLQHCRLIVRGGVGVDNVDLELARQREIPVANVPDYGSEEVADTAIAMALALARGVHYLNSRLRAWSSPAIPGISRNPGMRSLYSATPRAYSSSNRSRSGSRCFQTTYL